VSSAITSFVDAQQPALVSMGAELRPLQMMASQLLAGGKRLRPGFCVWSYVAAGGALGDNLAPVLSAAASLELLHASALVHDDVMDSSDLRRGVAAAHRQFEDLHRRSDWLGDPGAFGRAGAILLGDLLLMWSVQMLHRSGLPAVDLGRALPILEAMRTEVTCGQYLDVAAQARSLPQPTGTAESSPSDIEFALDEASRVVEYKSARYTVQRPCQLGAALAAGDGALQQALGAYGSPLGRAFQFRDDLLGVFGDTRLTGKPSGDDLREGKRTVLVAYAYAHASPTGQRLLLDRLGDPGLDADGVTALQQVIDDSGARESVETMINDCYTRAMEALAGADITQAGRTALTALADAAVRRAF
jgi:geranylgeranyl diphosphate synthase type I